MIWVDGICGRSRIVEKGKIVAMGIGLFPAFIIFFLFCFSPPVLLAERNHNSFCREDRTSKARLFCPQLLDFAV
jgi:hypothetical protein